MANGYKNVYFGKSYKQPPRVAVSAADKRLLIIKNKLKTVICERYYFYCSEYDCTATFKSLLYSLVSCKRFSSASLLVPLSQPDVHSAFLQRVVTDCTKNHNPQSSFISYNSHTQAHIFEHACMQVHRQACAHASTQKQTRCCHSTIFWNIASVSD